MIGTVNVMEPADYQEWLQQPRRGLAGAGGAQDLLKYRCISCHSADEHARAPVLEELYGRPVHLRDGRTVIADEDYIRESILDPGAKIVAGWENIMPTFKGQVSEEEIIELIAFIKSLRPGRDAAAGRGLSAARRDAAHQPAEGEAMSTATLRAADRCPLPPEEPRENLSQRRPRRAVLAADQGPQADRHPLPGHRHGDVLPRRRRHHHRPPQPDDAATAGWLTADTYNRLFTMHGVIMVFFFLVPVVPTVLGNFCLPLMIGAKDLAFPRINLASWYLFVIGAAWTLFAMLAGGVDTGWTFYTPYSSQVVALQRHAGADRHRHLRLLVDLHRPELHRHRPPHARPGPDLVAAADLRLDDLRHQLHLPAGRAGAGHGADPGGPRALAAHRRLRPGLGGDPLLFQHLFWFYSHPAVYIMILPGMGIVSEVIPCFARKNLFGYTAVALSSIGIATLSFLVWAHHMFVAGISMYAALIFSVLSYLVAVPSAIKVFNWTATLYKGSISLRGADAVRPGLRRPVHGGRPDRAVPGVAGHGHARSRHLFRHRPFPFHHGRRHGHGLHGRPALLVAEDHRPHVLRLVVEAGGADHLRRLLPDLPAAVRRWATPGCRAATIAIRRSIQVWNVMSSAGASILAVGYVLPLCYLLLFAGYGPAGRAEPLARDRTGMADAVAAAQGQLRGNARRRPRTLRVPPGEGPE